MTAPKKTKSRRQNIFFKYFVMFSCIFLVIFMALGTTLILLVNTYSLNEKTQLLEENTKSIANNISSTLIVNNMNSRYSSEKAAVCESMKFVSNCIDADIFVCDTGGQVILCKEQTGLTGYYSQTMTCRKHSRYQIGDSLIQSVYENKSAVTRTVINGEQCYVVGTAITAPSYDESGGSSTRIIGSVFAIVAAGTTDLVHNVIKTFFLASLICLIVGFAAMWILTRQMVKPLQQMSAAAKRFAVGDFSYRVKVHGNDELSDLANAFNDMANALDKLENSRRSFVANVSHELKTPMTSIAGFIDGILDGTIPKSKQDYYLKIVSDEVRRLSRLVVAMLNMSKIESGDFEMKPKNYNRPNYSYPAHL